MLVLVYRKRKILEWPFAIALTPEKLEKGLRLQADCSQSIYDFLEVFYYLFTQLSGFWVALS